MSYKGAAMKAFSVHMTVFIAVFGSIKGDKQPHWWLLNALPLEAGKTT
jgi:hypothetical protein